MELAIVAQIVQLSRDCPAEKCTLDARSSSCGHGGLVDPVNDTWDGWEHVRLQDRKVIEELQGIACGVTNLRTHTDRYQLHDTLKVAI